MEEKKAGRKVTRKDIAEQAQTSVSVVSRALNNSGYVRRDLREKILRIAEELNYSPNPVAMSLQQRRTRQILFYCQDLYNAFNVDLYSGMLAEAKKRGYMMLLNGSGDFSKVKEAMIDGIILENERMAAAYEETLGRNYYLPAVYAGYGSRAQIRRSLPVVEWDTEAGMELALKYLRRMGHRRIACAGPSLPDRLEIRTFSWRVQMKAVYGEKVDAYYFCPPEEAASEADNGIFRKGILTARVFLERRPQVSAVICFNDEFAFGMIQELLKKGIRIPEDLSVMSFDGSVRRAFMHPALTSVTGYPREQGEKLAGTLIDLIEGKNVKSVQKIASVVLEGESVRRLEPQAVSQGRQKKK